MMELTESIAFVRRYNAWRRNDDESEMPHPKDIGQAIDALCGHAERLQRELEQERQDRKQAEADVCRALGERNDARAKALALEDGNEDMRDLLREIFNLTQLKRDCPIDLPHRALVHIGHLIEEKTPPLKQ